MAKDEREDWQVEMDAAAKSAEREFGKCRTAQDVVEWWAKWYLKAGYKRLGRFLKSKAKETK